MELFRNPDFDFLGKKAYCIAASAVLVLAGIFSMTTLGIPLGIDFRGGADVQLKFRDAPDVGGLRAALGEAGFGSVTIQTIGAAGDNEVLIRLDPRSEGEEGEEGVREQEDIATDILSALRTDEDKAALQGRSDLNVVGENEIRQSLQEALGAGAGEEASRAAAAITAERNRLGGLLPGLDSVRSLPEVSAGAASWLDSSAVAGRFAIRSVDYVGPAVGSDLRSKARWAVIMSLAAMLVYIGFRFHATSYGVAAIVTLAHDVLITLGFISVFQKEFDLSVLAAVLTIVGYSVNDTIVVFDRVRDNLRLHRQTKLEKIFNDSINQCLSRTILTTLLVFIVLFSIWVFGGSRLEPFAFALLVGTVSGTYSTIYIAAPTVILWNSLAQKRAKLAQRRAQAA
jgi:preprotein translocase subunit SecF